MSYELKRRISSGALNLAPGQTATLPMSLPITGAESRVVLSMTCFAEGEPALQVRLNGMSVDPVRIQEIPTWWRLLSRRWRKWRLEFRLPVEAQ